MQYPVEDIAGVAYRLVLVVVAQAIGCCQVYNILPVSETGALTVYLIQ